MRKPTVKLSDIIFGIIAAPVVLVVLVLLALLALGVWIAVSLIMAGAA